MTGPPPHQETLTNQRLIAGRYRLRRVIGRGSMGVVWLAYDEMLHRPVAVKEVQLPAGMPAAEANDARERTLREARAIAALTHPNVVAVHDVAKQGIEPFVVMELLPGRSLAQVVGRAGALNTEQAATVADAVAAGLAAAHRRGITHRDVKPGNVLVGEDGQVKLTDFGISRNVSEVTMTSSGLVLGTPAYIAPEVAAGDPVTSAADLWGLGATLFAAVEGRPPYDAGGDALETVNEVVHGEVPVPSGDSPLAEVIAGLMVKDPARRMSLVEVRRRIRPLLPEPGGVVFPPDEPDPQAGPADNKPTTHLNPVPEPEASGPVAPVPLAADPGPLPFALSQPDPVPAPLAPLPLALPQPVSAPLAPAPGPLPFARRRARRRRGPLASGLLFVLAVLLFVVAAGGGFVAARTLAGRPLLPPSHAPTTPTTNSPPIPVTTFVTVTAQAAVTSGTPGGNFTVSVPAGWAKFVEQRGRQGPLPDSTAVRWVRSDGEAELTVERFAGFQPKGPSDYTDAVRAADPDGKLLSASNAPGEYLFRTSTSGRSMYFKEVQGDGDLWVLSVTVPTIAEDSGLTDLYDKISPTFHVTS
ncbi:MAG TPA: serine/threonine-protein kinase [Pseudonocardiaceae bacterium]|nr:serine/threonine-protein kinase [Pseudonocardiaceae bacterium]